MKSQQTTKQVGQSVEVSRCENCGQEFKSKYKTFTERFCSTYCQEDWNFRVSVEERYE